jgi:hypothetical protein
MITIMIMSKNKTLMADVRTKPESFTSRKNIWENGTVRS